MAELLHTHMHVGLTFCVKITGQETALPPDADECDQFILGMNRRLLLALLQRDGDLQRFLLSQIGVSMENLPWEQGRGSWEGLLLDTTTEETEAEHLLAPVAAQLDQDDQRTFQSWAQGDFLTQIDRLIRSIHIDLNEIKIGAEHHHEAKQGLPHAPTPASQPTIAPAKQRHHKNRQKRKRR